ncbi:hypothetical protein LGL98_21860 [Klebsiella africana]|nr:hypothetical protein [Klebsiella africana]UDD39800.1 hypothetical protein LGL98_21860 [Klebsiella africana]
MAQAVTAAMQGLAGGNLAQAASGAVSPYVAEIIHSQTTEGECGSQCDGARGVGSDSGGIGK